jgi:haloalkane dehalogenase
MPAPSVDRRAGVAEEYQFASHFLDFGGLKYHYLDEVPHSPRTSPAGPLLFVHGNPTWSFAWRNLIRGLSGDRRCVAVDHIGCGLSDKPQDYAYTLAQHVNNLVRLIEALDLQNITLVGHDWGGCIGMGAAVRQPHRFRRFVLMNTAAFRSTQIPLRIALCRIPVLGPLGVRGLNLFSRAALWMAVSDRRRMSLVARRGYLAPYNSWANRIAVLRFVEDIPLRPSHPSYPTLTSIEEGLAQFADRPMLLVWGMRDWCFTPAFLDEWVRRFPDAEVQRLERASHYLFEDEPDAVLACLRNFLDRHER